MNLKRSNSITEKLNFNQRYELYIKKNVKNFKHLFKSFMMKLYKEVVLQHNIKQNQITIIFLKHIILIFIIKFVNVEIHITLIFFSCL